MNIMTQSEAAAMLGKSRQYINELLRDGKIRRYGKKVDFDELMLYRSGGSDPARDGQREWQGGKGLPRGTKKQEKIDYAHDDKRKVPTFAEAKTKREIHMAQIAELTYKEKKGELIERATVLSIIDQAFSDINQGLSDIPYKIKANFPDSSEDLIGFLDALVNNIKKSISEKRVE